jgi:hypothetical protein
MTPRLAELALVHLVLVVGADQEALLRVSVEAPRAAALAV